MIKLTAPIPGIGMRFKNIETIAILESIIAFLISTTITLFDSVTKLESEIVVADDFICIILEDKSSLKGEDIILPTILKVKTTNSITEIIRIPVVK